METINSRSLFPLMLLNAQSCSRTPIFAYHSITHTGSNYFNFTNVNLNLMLRLPGLRYSVLAKNASTFDYGHKWLLQSVVFSQHAQIQKTGGNLTVTDLESTYGTVIDETRLSPRVSTILSPARYITTGNQEPFQPPYLFRKVGPVKLNARRRKDSSTKKKETPAGLKWSSPKSPWVKINTDGCSKGSPGNSAAGGVIRDWDGEWKVGFSGNLGIRDSLMAELEAAAFGLELAYNRGYRNVILETDSTAVVEYLVNDLVAVPSQYGDLVRKCAEWKIKDWDCRVEHVKRDANMCADRLANKALKRGVGWVVFDDPPQEVMVELELDRGGFTWPKWDKF